MPVRWIVTYRVKGALFKKCDPADMVEIVPHTTKFGLVLRHLVVLFWNVRIHHTIWRKYDYDPQDEIDSIPYFADYLDDLGYGTAADAIRNVRVVKIRTVEGY